MSEHTFRTAVGDGLHVFVRDFPADGDAIGPPVLCLHGLSRNSRDFVPILPRIAAGGRRALAIDIRGRGLSDYDPEPQRYQPAVYAMDVATLMQGLGVPKAAFVGTSMGGLVTMILASFRPDLIERAALNDIGPMIEADGLARLNQYVGRLPDEPDWASAAARTRAINGIAFPGRDDAFFAAMARRHYREIEPGIIRPDYDPKIAEVFRKPGGAAPVDLWPFFDALAQQPVLVVRGALSDILSAETLAAMAARAGTVQAVTVPDVGHAPVLDEPAAWAALSRFLGLRP